MKIFSETMDFGSCLTTALKSAGQNIRNTIIMESTELSEDDMAAFVVTAGGVSTTKQLNARIAKQDDGSIFVSVTIHEGEVKEQFFGEPFMDGSFNKFVREAAQHVIGSIIALG